MGGGGGGEEGGREGGEEGEEERREEKRGEGEEEREERGGRGEEQVKEGDGLTTRLSSRSLMHSQVEQVNSHLPSLCSLPTSSIQLCTCQNGRDLEICSLTCCGS